MFNGWVNQAYSRLSTTHGHITYCKLDSVVCVVVCVWVNVDLSCLGWTIYARQFWVPSHRFNSATGEQKWITETIYTDSEPPSRMPVSLMPSARLRSANVFGVTRSGIEPWPPSPRANALSLCYSGAVRIGMGLSALSEHKKKIYKGLFLTTANCPLRGQARRWNRLCFYKLALFSYTADDWRKGHTLWAFPNRHSSN